MIVKSQLKRIIDEALLSVDMWSESASSLILGTGAVESGYRYLRQYPNGPAISFWQIEPDTALDYFVNYLQYRPHKWSVVIDACSLPERFKTEIPELNDVAKWLSCNLYFAIIMARLKYWRVPAPLPERDDIDAQAGYWAKYYNTSLGKGTPEKYIKSQEIFR